MAESINLEHSGSGDNVAGDKIVQSIQAGDFVKVAHELYYLINIESFDKTRSNLDAINQIPSKSAEVNKLLEIISIYQNAKEIKKIPDDINVIKEAIRLSPVDFKDFYRSILVELTYLSSESEALEIYNLFSRDASIYLENIKLRYFSNEDELKEVFSTQLIILDDLGLLFLARGLARVGKRVEALEALNKINKKNEFLEILAIALDFDILLKDLDRPLMYLEKNIVEKFLSITTNFLELIRDKNTLNDMSLRLLTNLLVTSDFSISNLMDKALDFIDSIRPINSEVIEILEKYSKFKVELSTDVLDKIKNLQPLSFDESLLILNSIKYQKTHINKIINWVSKCGIIEEDNNFNKDLVLLVLKSFVFKDKQNIEDFQNDFDKFIEHKEKKLRTIQPFFVILLCENLFEFKKSQLINLNKFLEIFITKNNYESVIYLYYLYSLLNLEKYESLNDHLSKIDIDKVDASFLFFRARYYCAIKNYENSKKDYIKVLEHYKNSVNIWLEYISLSLICDDISETRKILPLIPEDLLKPRAKNIFNLITLIYIRVDPVYAEKLLGKLFLLDPDFVATYLCNIHFQLISQSIELLNDISYADIYEGVIYEVDGKRKQKLIVSEEFAKYSYFVNVDCELGSNLIRMDPGEQEQVGHQKIKLIEKQPPIVTIFQIALEISEENRHNSSHPTFLSFNIRKDFVVDDMKEILKHFALNDHTEELLSNRELSMYIKGSLFKEHEEFEVILKILQNKDANFCLSNDVGNTVASESIVLDAYSFTYLCLNHNFKALIDSGINVFLTQETYNVISAWIKKVTDEKFLSLSLVDNSLIKTDATTVENFYASFIDQLDQLLSYTEILSPNIIDLPDFANEIRDILSPSVFSTLKLSISNDIPWLCLDSALRTIFIKQDDVRVVRLHDFLIFIGNYLDFDSRKISMIQWLNFGLFTIYTYADLFELAKSTNSEDWELLTNLLKNTPLRFQTKEQALLILSYILQFVCIKYLSEIDFKKNFIIENLVFACLDKCMESLEGEFREDRLVNLILKTIEGIEVYGNLIKIFGSLMGKYAQGHFLNINYMDKKIVTLLQNE